MYLNEIEKAKLKSIENAIVRHNNEHKGNGILAITTYIADGNRVDIRLGTIGILGGLTIEQAYWCIHSIYNYANAQGR